MVRRPGADDRPSYLGHTPWAVAPYLDPPLRSVSSNITAAKITAAFYEKGTPGIQNVLNWTGVTSRQERDLPGVIPDPRQMAQMKRALRTVPLQAAGVDPAGAPSPSGRTVPGASPVRAVNPSVSCDLRVFVDDHRSDHVARL